MTLDTISLFSVSYIIFTTILFVLYYKQANKQYISSSVSGLVLLSYSTYLHVSHTLQQNGYVLVLSVAMLQLAAFESGRRFKKMNWLYQAILLIIHGVIVYFMLA